MPKDSGGTAPTVFVAADGPTEWLKKDWKPYKGSAELPPASYTDKLRERRMTDGSVYTRKETIFKGSGDPRYKISESGDLIKIYRNRVGTGTRLVYQFKRAYGENDAGRMRKRFDVAFRKHLRACGVPGA
jgi:hypothetical protein